MKTHSPRFAVIFLQNFNEILSKGLRFFSVS